MVTTWVEKNHRRFELLQRFLNGELDAKLFVQEFSDLRHQGAREVAAARLRASLQSPNDLFSAEELKLQYMLSEAFDACDRFEPDPEDRGDPWAYDESQLTHALQEIVGRYAPSRRK